MRNPLTKRLPRELKHEFGKYLVIFLFMVMLISLVSGFLIADDSFKAEYDEGFTTYNIEDGHITFDKQPTDEILSQIEEEADLTFYPLCYFEEENEETGANIRVYEDRDIVNTECLMEGQMPTAENEIALDRMHADNTNLAVGDTMTLNGKTLTITGLIAVPDYSCLYEDNSDMMFDALTFGVAVMTPEGFEAVESKQFYYNYAWKYNTPYDYDDDAEADKRSDDLLDVLEDVLKDYDHAIVQAQVDDLYDQAESLSSQLEDQFDTAGDTIEDKLTDASEDLAEEAEDSLGSEGIMDAVLGEAGMSRATFAKRFEESAGLTDEQKAMYDMISGSLTDMEKIGAVMTMAGISSDSLFDRMLSITGLSEEDAGTAILDAYAEKQGTTSDGLLAEKLGTTEAAFTAMKDALEDADDMVDETKTEDEDHTIDWDALEDDTDGSTYEEDVDFSTDDIHDVVDKIAATGIYDMSDINATLDQIDELTEFEIDETDIIGVDAYVPLYVNQAVNFTGDDMGSDKSMFILFDYIVVVIMAFIFAVTTLNTLTQEAGVIGTLRASGYTRGELVRHYMILPIIVTLVAGVIGNILGYTVMKDVMVGVYMNSYSLATFVPIWNANAFIITTVIPIAMMFVINLVVLSVKMRISPLQFLRHELSKRSRKKAVRLNTKIPFLNRFRIRIFFQNISNYVIMFFGIVLASIIMVFGLMFTPLLDDYAELVCESKICNYQYVLNDQVETENTDAEKYCMGSLECTIPGYLTDEISAFGIADDSKYIDAEIPEGQILVSNGLADKYGLSAGDSFTLDDKYSDKTYEFTVAGVYRYDAALSVFMDFETYRKTFDEDDDYFTGYFSDEELTDLDEDDIATIVTSQDLQSLSNQLKKSMGEFMNLFKYFGAIMFVLIVYLLSKQVIEKNAQSISMCKILGFKDGEIGGLYIVSTSVVVLISLLASIPIVYYILRWAFKFYMYKEMTGYIPFIVRSNCYVITVIVGIVCYALVAFIQLLKIRKIPKSDALKNVE